MRFKLTLKVEKECFGNAIPINYQYELSAVIYKILSKSSEQYATWLHDNGFELGWKRFKLFTFSRLIVPQYDIDKKNERLILQSNSVEWYISFLPEKSTEKFIQGIFSSQNFEIGDKKSCVRFAVQHVEVLPALTYREEGITFETMSPICISTRDNEMVPKYLSPADEKARGNILLGLMHKYEAFFGKKYEGVIKYNFEILNDPKPVLTKIKAGMPEETKVKGYLCKFKIKLPEELMRVMYEGGIGEKGSLGFGMVRAEPF
ncbi:hypothetical protein EZS27_006405 [termite gut metagenome]|uniref:CRISPR associated protein Cas6 C-terminal domain-containing protein n=1 Tax=termite gut metagenome TaxID=433724 RepID=A0A5J4SJ97_9ZZZZ